MDGKLKASKEKLYAKLGGTRRKGIRTYRVQRSFKKALPIRLAKIDATFGALNKYAHPAKITQEANAWQSAAEEKHYAS